MTGKKVYIAGKITGFDGFKEKFSEAEKVLNEIGATTLNPAILPKGFTQEEYLKVCFAMIDVCEMVYFLDNWTKSPGAKAEHEYATSIGKEIMYEVAA